MGEGCHLVISGPVEQDPNKGCVGVALSPSHSQQFLKTPRMLVLQDFSGQDAMQPQLQWDGGGEIAIPFRILSMEILLSQEWKQSGSPLPPSLAWPVIHLSSTVFALSILEVWELLGEGEAGKKTHAHSSLHTYSIGSRPMSSGSESALPCSWNPAVG